MRFAGLLLVALAAGCSTKTINEMSYSEVQTYAAQMVDKCRKQGVPEAQMKACAMQEARADQSRRAKQRAFGEAMAEAGDSYSRSARSSAPINCTSTGYGNMVRTSCY